MYIVCACFRYGHTHKNNPGARWLTSVSFTSQETLIVKSNWAKFDGLVNFQMSGPPGQRHFELGGENLAIVMFPYHLFLGGGGGV